MTCNERIHCRQKMRYRCLIEIATGFAVRRWNLRLVFFNKTFKRSVKCQWSAISLEISENEVCFQCCEFFGGLHELARFLSQIRKRNFQKAISYLPKLLYNVSPRASYTRQIQILHTVDTDAQRCCIAKILIAMRWRCMLIF